MAVFVIVATAAVENPYGFIHDPQPGSPIAWFGMLFLLLWLFAILITIVRAGLWRAKLVKRSTDRSLEADPAPAELPAFDRAINFLDRSVYLSLLLGLFVTLALVYRTLIKIGAAGRADFAAVAGPWGEALVPLIFAFCVSLIAGLSSTTLHLPASRVSRSTASDLP